MNMFWMNSYVLAPGERKTYLLADIAYYAGKYSISIPISPTYCYFSKEWKKGICGQKMG